MLLCIDIGNTNIKLGLFDRERIAYRWRIATDRNRLADEYAVLLLNLLAMQDLRKEQITACAISSVVPVLTPIFIELMEDHLHLSPLVVRPGTVTGMAIHTDYPAEVGSDLIVNALAARALYGAPAIVISFGTATTFVGISRAGDFEGVAIAPGIASSSDSLFRAASTLPQMSLARPPAVIGKNTIHSMQAGVLFGFVGLVKEMVARMQVELGGGAHVIATGGLTPLILLETDVITAYEPDLALIGLRLVVEAGPQPN